MHAYLSVARRAISARILGGMMSCYERTCALVSCGDSVRTMQGPAFSPNLLNLE